MKIAFIFPPMWNPLSNGSLAIWNQQVTSRLARDSGIVVYCGGFSEKENKACKGVHYKRISTNYDGRIESLRIERLYNKYHAIVSMLNNEAARPFHTCPFFCFEYVLRVACDLRRQRCDVVHIYNYPQFIPIIKYLNPGIRIVLNVHGENLSQYKFISVRRYLRKADCIVSCSEWISGKLRRKFPEFASRCETVFMGLDPDHFSPKKAAAFAGPSEMERLLYVGRLSPEKGLHVLLDAFPKVADHYPGAVLDIVGSGVGIIPFEYLEGYSMAPSHFAELKQFLSEGYRVSDLLKRISPNLVSRVIFHGHVPHGELPDYYTNADVYINPSYWESFGMSNIEAMACGVPVVATKVGAVPEVIEHGRTGILVEAGNSLALADGIIRLLDDASFRNSIAEAASVKAVSCYSWRGVSEKLYTLYSKIL